jgi:hypothetical protein
MTFHDKLAIKAMQVPCGTLLTGFGLLSLPCLEFILQHKVLIRR